MDDTRQTKSAPSPIQKRISLLLVAVLLLIGGAMLWIQNHYEPADWHEQNLMTSKPPQTEVDLPDGLVTISPPEQYNAETLSNKINGKAELYFSAGFKRLESQRFALASAKNRWMESYLYDMGEHQNAFAVYSVQRRKDTQDIDLTPQSYLSSNGLFLVHGPYYLEIIAAEATTQMQSQMRALASSFITANPAKQSHLPVLELFVSENRLPHTMKLIADSAFGIQGLNWVYTALYTEENAESTVFIAKRESVSQARAQADKCIAYWNEYGGEPVETPDGFPPVQIVFILDNYEMVAVQGDYLYGVHESTDLDFSLKLISRMQQLIGGVEK